MPPPPAMTKPSRDTSNAREAVSGASCAHGRAAEHKWGGGLWVGAAGCARRARAASVRGACGVTVRVRGMRRVSWGVAAHCIWWRARPSRRT
eukprot:5261576-Prymnesium_polylepis.1